jgi:hypothetical protein
MPLPGPDLLTSFLTGTWEGYDGKHVPRDTSVVIDGFDVSGCCHGVNVDLKPGDIDITGYGDRVRSYMPSFKAGKFEVDLFFDPEVVPVALWRTLDSGEAVWVEVRPHASSAPSVTNPSFAANCVAMSTMPFSGNVGEAAASSVELQSTGEVLTLYG